MTASRTFGRRNAPDPRPKMKSIPSELQRTGGGDLGDNGGKLAFQLLRNAALGALIVVGVSSVIAIRANTAAPSEAAEVQETPAPPKPEPCGATLAEFYKLRTGMRYLDVKRIIGCDGEISSQVEMAGINTSLVSWQATDRFIGSMNATFQNGKLVARAQFGLK